MWLSLSDFLCDSLALSPSLSLSLVLSGAFDCRCVLKLRIQIWTSLTCKKTMLQVMHFCQVTYVFNGKQIETRGVLELLKKWANWSTGDVTNWSTGWLDKHSCACREPTAAGGVHLHLQNAKESNCIGLQVDTWVLEQRIHYSCSLLANSNPLQYC